MATRGCIVAGRSFPAPPRAWRDGRRYSYLESTGRAGFAWEWLRRTDEYQCAWQTRNGMPQSPRGFGLESWVDPRLPAAVARPIWHAGADPGVLTITAITPTSAACDTVDLLRLAPWSSVAIDGNDDEHWLISNGRWAVRLDVAGDTLLGGRFEPTFALAGLARLKRSLRAIERLRQLARADTLPRRLLPDHAWATRWIAELRTADAMAEGARTRDIAEGLFGVQTGGDSWRLDQESYRSRTRRLMRAARQRLRPPVTDYWFR